MSEILTSTFVLAVNDLAASKKFTWTSLVSSKTSALMAGHS